MIEFWLAFNNGAEKLRLPVPPQSFEVSTGMQNTTVTLQELGELNLIGRRRLKSITLSSYFPIRDDGLCQYRGFPSPAECIDRIARWRESGRPIRLLIVGETFRMNEAMAIESFTVSQRKGPEDIYYSLELKEYRFVHRQEDQNGAADAVALLAAYTGTRGGENRTVPASYTVREGDSLWLIARQMYGDGSRFREIMKLNGIQDEFDIAPGMVIAL